MSDPGDNVTEQIGFGLQYIMQKYGDRQFYPGSKTPVQENPGAEPDTKPDLGEPRIFTVAGLPVEMYTVGQLAAALNRKAVTIRRWENEGVIPKARFRKGGAFGDVRGSRRYYSRAQVEGMVRIAEEEGILHDLGRAISGTNFTARVIELFKETA